MVLISDFAIAFSVCVSNYVVRKLYLLIYLGIGFVIGFRFQDLVISDVAPCNPVEV
jgi:hypothetical protein